MNNQKSTVINALNDKAKMYEEKGMSSYDAIEQVASEFQLNVLQEGDACRIYETPGGMLVNCYITETDADSSHPKNVKFNNNVSWFVSN